MVDRAQDNKVEEILKKTDDWDGVAVYAVARRHSTANLSKPKFAGL